ncbi:MAG: hypothetical protein JO236_06485 [Mycobacterium sp.]|uniref:hypothetical protein n=1 Tax=Mycobacterium sp. TaxID=1785 RepID=UPI001ED3E008|nr:hypothetical protein [Mycobacterium sp.]MBW0017174.1 hypothetical protein [Mycobacterium sp.]
MRLSQALIAAALAATTATVPGCSNKTTPSTTTSGQATSATSTASSAAPTSSAPGQPTDYTGLLIKGSDIESPEPFNSSPPTQNPNGQPGVATTFSVQDGSRVIHDTIQVLADPGAATDALNAAKAGFGKTLKDPKIDQTNVGAGGTTAFGNTVDGAHGEAILVFTEGRAVVTLEFAGPPDLAPPPDFVNDVGQKQDAAVKKGLGG